MNLKLNINTEIRKIQTELRSKYKKRDNPIGYLDSISEELINKVKSFQIAKFNDTLKDYVIHLLTEQLVDVEEEYKLHYLLENVYNSAYNIYFSNIMPPRSYKTTYIRKIPNTKKMDVGSKEAYYKKIYWK